MQNFEIHTRDGLTLYGQKTEPTTQTGEGPKALVCIIHGFGEHQGRYEHVRKAFNDHGMIVYTMDLRGHGISEGKRGHATKHSYLIDDVENLLMYAREQYNDTPMFLMGHSFGGHIVAEFLLKKTTGEITAAILSAPWLKLAFEPPAFKVQLAKMMARLYPAYSDTSEMDVSKLSKDPQVVSSYENDPLVLKSITAGLFVSILETGKWIIYNAGKLKVPTLLYHGNADEIISIDGSREFAENAGKELLKYVELEGVYHEPHNDLEKQEVMKMCVEWILQHL